MLKLGLKSKFGMALASTALGAALIGGGTFALFTSEATNAGNTFTAGTLEIADVTGGAAFSTTTYFENLAPGDSEESKLKIENTGSLDAWVQIDSDNTKGTGALFEGDNPLTLNLPSNAVYVEAGATVEIPVSYSFPLAAGNEYQGATGQADIKVKAVQVRNNTLDSDNDGSFSDETGPQAWN